MTLRQLCNVAYVMQTEWMDEKEFAVFEKELNSDPSRGPVNRGVNDLMGVMMGTRR